MLEKKSADVAESGGDAPPGRRRRADRAIETRRKLIDAAAKVVGAEGYANASVARITALAEIAQGTFYNYFASQQDLFDQLLPELGTELIEFIRERIARESGSFKREEIGFRAFFDFLAERPEFYRILNEAETFAPKAYHDHMRNMAEGYMRALTRSHAKGELPGYERRELEVIIYTMLGARNYLAYRYHFRDGRPRRLPAWVDRAYMKLMTGGMLYGGMDAPPRRSRRSARSADRADADIALHFHAAPSNHGEARIEFEVTNASLGADGTIRQGVLLKLIEAAAMAAASDISQSSPRLVSLSTTFPHPVGSEDLSAVARAQANGSVIHVGVDLHASDGGERVIATAQAVYEAESRAKPWNES
jgi:AcrR family transcriptional regulator